MLTDVMIGGSGKTYGKRGWPLFKSSSKAAIFAIHTWMGASMAVAVWQTVWHA